MYKYKRGISNIEDSKKVDFSLSNNLETYLYMNASLENQKPFHGYYIKNDKMILANVYEKIEVGRLEYTVSQMSVGPKKFSCDEYINSIDLDESKFEYDIGQVQYKKIVSFIENENLMYIEYTVVNNSNSKIKFKIVPCITYRDLMETKKSRYLKFNNRSVGDGVLLNLSVTNQENIVLKSDFAEFDSQSSYINNVKYEYTEEDDEKKTFSDDLYIPGNFVTSVNKGDMKKIGLYVSDVDFSVSKYENSEKLRSEKIRKDRIKENIKEEYVELRNLAVTIDNLNFKKLKIASLPNIYELNIETAGNILKAIEGQYLVFGNIEDAYATLKYIFKYILKQIENDKKINDNLDFILLKLWFVESANRVIQKSKDDHINKGILNEISLIMEEFIDEKIYEENGFNKYISFVSLWYNALKIYENLLNDDKKEAIELIILHEKVKKDIESKFWIEEKRIMKRHLDDEENIATVEMLLTLSLSYQCVFESIPAKLLDTIFKELYTPYGLREFSKNSSKNTGKIYPRYMAHFVKANLRQNGVTRASQKIAYNMAKELILDIDKYVNGGIKRIYHERGINIDNGVYDLHTNAEVIRLYSMLT